MSCGEIVLVKSSHFFAFKRTGLFVVLTGFDGTHLAQQLDTTGNLSTEQIVIPRLRSKIERLIIGEKMEQNLSK